MWGDKVLEDVRAAREALAERFGFDLHAIVADLRKREATSGHPVLQPTPRQANGRPASQLLPDQTKPNNGTLVS